MCFASQWQCLRHWELPLETCYYNYLEQVHSFSDRATEPTISSETVAETSSRSPHSPLNLLLTVRLLLYTGVPLLGAHIHNTYFPELSCHLSRNNLLATDMIFPLQEQACAVEEIVQLLRRRFLRFQCSLFLLAVGRGEPKWSVERVLLSQFARDEYLHTE